MLAQHKQMQERERIRQEIQVEMEKQAQAYLSQQIELERQKISKEFDSELQSRVNALSISKTSHAPMVDMHEDSEKESLVRLAGMGGRRSLQANTANMIQNRSSLSSDDE